MHLSFQKVTKKFTTLPVVDNFDCELGAGELLALVGPSGCGKSTLLHMAAGLESASSGRILADGQAIGAPNPARMLMFQENALFPWLSLAQNVAMALELQGKSRPQAKEQALAWLAKVKLQGFEDFYPHQVSGGMRQRCALARAFISHPEVLLLDEPFGALDALTRLTLQDVLRELIAETRPSVILVTHDVDEALYLADRLIVFSPRPAKVLQEFHPKRSGGARDSTANLAMRAEILRLLGISHTETQSTNILEELAA